MNTHLWLSDTYNLSTAKKKNKNKNIEPLKLQEQQIMPDDFQKHQVLSWRLTLRFQRIHFYVIATFSFTN